MSDSERVGAELFVEGIAAFEQGMGSAGSAMEGLGTVAANVGGGALDAFGGAISAVGTAVAGTLAAGLAVGASAFIAFGAGVVNGAFEAEQSQLVIGRLGRQLTAMGDSTDITVAQVEALGQSFAGLAGGSDDAVIAIQQIAINSQAVSSEALPGFIQASLDLGAVMGDNAAAANILARAFDQPSSAIPLLRRQHILLTDAQEQQIKTMEANGNEAGALAIIQGVLADATGGAALANAQTLTGAWGVFTGTIGEAFEEIGANFLPIMQTMGAFILSTVVPAVQTLATGFSTLVSSLFAGGDISATFTNFGAVVATVFPGVQVYFDAFGLAIESLVAFVQTNLPAIQETFGVVWTAIGTATTALVDVWNTQLGPALSGAFTAIFGQAPTAQETMTAMLDAISLGAQAVATWVTTVLVPAVTQFSSWITTDFVPLALEMQTWLQTNIPIAVQTLSDFWNNILQPALSFVWDFITNNVIPVFNTLANQALALFQSESQETSDLITNTIIPAFNSMWDFINTSVIPVLTTLWEFIDTNIIPIMQSLATIAIEGVRIAFEALVLYYNTSLKPAFDALALILNDTVKPAFDTLGLLIRDNVQPIFDTFKVMTIDALTGAFNTLQGAIALAKQWLDDLATTLSNIHIPSDLTPGSPTPFELGMRGIASAVSDVTAEMIALNSVNRSMSPIGLAGGMGSSGATERVSMGMVAGGGGVTYNNNVNVQASYPRYTSPPSLYSEINQGLNLARA